MQSCLKYVHVCTSSFELSLPSAATTALSPASCYGNTEAKLTLGCRAGAVSEKETPELRYWNTAESINIDQIFCSFGLSHGALCIGHG